MLDIRKVRISLIIIILTICSTQQWSVGTTIVVQDSVGPEDLLSRDTVTISTDLFSTCLEVGCTRNGGIFEARDLGSQVMLLLSLNNQSWVEVEQFGFEANVLDTNVSTTFKVCNTLFQSFPFDVEQGETLYVSMEYEYGSQSDLGDHTYRTPSMAVVVPVDIIRPWYFTMDWMFPGVLGVSLLCLVAIFLKSRRGIIIVD